MKKALTLLASLLMLVSVLALPVFATPPLPDYAYVTLADENGKLILVMEKVELGTERTIDETLRLAHERLTGEKAEYASEDTAFGRSLTTLLGVSGGAYGYYINDMSPMSLLDTVDHGDHIYAFVYTDLASFSDTYSYFDIHRAQLEKGESLTLTLKTSGFDENFMPKQEVLSGAVITVNGEKTEFLTDENGKVTLPLQKSGELILSAEKDGMTLVPPVYVVTVEGSLGIFAILGIAVLVIAAGVLLFRVIKGKNR